MSSSYEAAVIRSWQGNWNKYARDVFGIRLDKDQRAILESVQYNKMTSVVSGTARGKDFVAAVASMCFLYLTPRWDKDGNLIANTKIALTAPTDRQVKNIMMPEISRLFSRARNRGFILPGKLNKYDIRTEHDEWFLTGFKADEYNHEAWSGFHAVNTMFVVTEATGISDGTFDAIEGNLQGNSRILIVFNPNRSNGYAAKSQKQDRWHSFKLSCLNAPNVRHKKNVIKGQVDYEWVKDKVETWCDPISQEEANITDDDFLFEGRWYRPNDTFRIKVLGTFSKVASDVLIPEQWIEAAEERYRNLSRIEQAGQANQKTIIGLDVAGMGRDFTVFARRKGNVLVNFTAYNSGGNADHMKIAGQAAANLTAGNAELISIDTIGEGAGVYSALLEQGHGDKVISCKYSESAKDLRDNPLTDTTGEYTFANMRAYLFWAVREWLDPRSGNNAAIPPNSGLMEEATEIRWSFRSDGKIMIEKKEDIKKRIGKSPDKFDALANTFYPAETMLPATAPITKEYAEQMQSILY